MCNTHKSRSICSDAFCIKEKNQFYTKEPFHTGVFTNIFPHEKLHRGVLKTNFGLGQTKFAFHHQLCVRRAQSAERVAFRSMVFAAA